MMGQAVLVIYFFVLFGYEWYRTGNDVLNMELDKYYFKELEILKKAEEEYGID